MKGEEITVVLGGESGGYSWQASRGTGVELGITMHSQGNDIGCPNWG